MHTVESIFSILRGDPCCRLFVLSLSAAHDHECQSPPGLETAEDRVTARVTWLREHACMQLRSIA